MKCLDLGHKYELSNGETLTFIKRVNGELVWNGLQNEEVLMVILDRLHYLQGMMPCSENMVAISSLEKTLDALHLRTQKRVVQGVETTDIPHRS